MDMENSIAKIKQEPGDFKEATGVYFDVTLDQDPEDNTQVLELSSVKTEGIVELGEEYISLIKLDPELTNDASNLLIEDPLEPEVDKSKEDSLLLDNPRSSVYLRKRGAATNKLSHAKTKCPHCAKMIAFTSISDHVRMVHRPVVCDICNKGFSDEVTLKRHKNTVHVDKSSDKRFKWKCDYCDARFMRTNRLVRHCRNIHKIFL